MRKVAVELAMLVRMTKRLVVEVPDDFDPIADDKTSDEILKDRILNDIWLDDDGTGFEMDDSWGCEEGTHCFIGDVSNDSAAQYRYVVDEDGFGELVRVND